MDFIMNGANRINILLNDLERYTSISMETPEGAIVQSAQSLEKSQTALQNIK
jgi:hypothetical protein